MLEKLKLTILFLSTLIVGYGLVGGLMQKASAGDEAYRDLSMFTKVLDRIQQDYVEEPDMQRALQGAVHGMMEALDPFSSFVHSSVYQELVDRGGSASVGLTLSKRYGYAYVVSSETGSPAESVGLRTGDLIESIDGEPTVLMSLWEARHRLLGPEGSRVALRVIRSRRSEPEEIEIARRGIEVPEVTTRLVEERIGVLRIPDLAEGSAEAARVQLNRLISSGARSLLIDIRSASEGELDEAVKLADLFLEPGAEIGTLKGRKSETQVYSATQSPLVADMPVTLLVDGGTSGPGELFVAALKDNGMADILGTRTNGHGSVQGQFTLHDGSVLVISTHFIYRPNGDPIQSDEIRASGLEPDQISPPRDFVSNYYFEHGTETEHEGEELSEAFYNKLDKAIQKRQMDAALEHLRGKMQRQEEEIDQKVA